MENDVKNWIQYNLYKEYKLTQQKHSKEGVLLHNFYFQEITSGVSRRSVIGRKMQLSLCTKLAYGVGHVLNDLCSAVWFTYALVFYMFIIKLSSMNAGALLLLGQIADAVTTPIVGILSDRNIGCSSLFLRYGKRKTWHLLGTILVCLTFPFMYSPCLGCQDSSNIVKAIYYGTFIVFFQLAWAFVQIAHLSLAPDLTSDQHERTHLISIRTSFAVLANMTVYSVAWGVLSVDNTKHELDPSYMLEFQILAYVVTAVGIVASFFFHIFVKETELDEALIDDEGNVRRRPIKNIFKKLGLYQVAIIYMCARLFGNMTQTMIPMYVNQALHLDTRNIAVVPFVMYIASFLMSLVNGPMNNHLGRKVSFAIGGFMGVGGVVWMWLEDDYNYKTYFIYIVAVLLGCCQSTFLVTSIGLIADFIDEDIGNGAFIYGIMSFTDKLSSGAVIMAIQSINPNQPGSYYTYATVISCGVSAVLGTIATLLLRSKHTSSSVVHGEEAHPHA